MDEVVNLPEPCVVILAGPGASGKSTWAAQHFSPESVVSSDRLRAVVGAGEDDLEASADAFAVLDDIVRRRVGRRLTTVIDTLGLDPRRRTTWLGWARDQGIPCVAVAFDTPAPECRARNRGRSKRIPADVLTTQLRAWPASRDALATEGYDSVLAPRPVRVVPRALVDASSAAQRQYERPTGLRFGLHIGSYVFGGGTAATADHLQTIAAGAEECGFDAIYVMDHFRQIPQIGRAWEDFLESYTTLAFLAASTARMRLGALVTGVTYRNVAHLGKILSTLDVLSRGRAICGLGLGWFADEHRAYGWDFPSVPERYAILSDALQLLPLLWGKGSPPFAGRALTVPETLCYPRPLQERIPIIVGGGGERRTLRLAARYGDAANVFGDVEAVRHKAEVLARHCVEVGRDPDEVALTHLSTALVADSDAHIAELVERLRPRRTSAARYANDVNAGTVNDHVGRFRQLAEAGVQEIMVRLPDLTDTGPLERMGRVIQAFR